MQNVDRFFLAALVAFLSSAPSLAAAQPSRAARLLTLGGDTLAVLIAPDQAWFPNSSTGTPLALCAGDRCAPVREVTSCDAPRCPGPGSVAIAERGVADVSGFPTDREGFGREVERIRQDPALQPLAWSYGTHPEPPPAPPQPLYFGRDGERGFRWELDAVAIGGVLAAHGEAIVGGEVSGGFRFLWEVRNDDDEFLMGMVGNSNGLDLRVRSFAVMPTQGPTLWALSIGIAPSLLVSPERESFRLPSGYGSILPEFGVVFREDRDAAWYAGWTLPVTFLVDPHLAVEMRATVLVIDDWIKGDDVDAVFTLGVGFVAR